MGIALGVARTRISGKPFQEAPLGRMVIAEVIRHTEGFLFTIAQHEMHGSRQATLLATQKLGIEAQLDDELGAFALRASLVSTTS